MTSLGDEIVDHMAKQYADHIDKQILDMIMIDALKTEGWTETNINPAFGKGSIVTEIDWYSQTAEWVHINATDDYKLIRGQWLFKNPADATLFVLRWK
jgi:hypothetical protein